MDGFLSWFFAFMTKILEGFWLSISSFFLGIVQIFNFPAYFDQVQQYKSNFGVFDWILVILTLLFTYAIFALIIVMLVLVVRKYIRFRHTLVGNEDLLEEIADLHRDLTRVTKEKERIMALKVGSTGISMDQINAIFDEREEAQQSENALESTEKTADLPTEAADEKEKQLIDSGAQRFFRLSAVDKEYEYYTAPEYERGMNLAEICEDIRNYACSQMKLYYEIKTLRLMIAGFASTKLVILQGISGTGKTSLPYMLGKYLKNDATISSVLPSWRDRTELFGYFNEFTKKFNETEVLKRIYEASYNDDLNVIVFDEMNIARVEYYFAEMLSILELPDPREWKIELVSSNWPSDPKKIDDGKLLIPQNLWYMGTANNDDSTFSISDKVYDRAQVINLDSKGVPFDAPEAQGKLISYSYIASLYDEAMAKYPISNRSHDNILKLDMYVIQKFRVAFGNRILKQLNMFVPVYVACGGTEVEGIDYILATKVYRKFESLNLSLIRDEIKGLINFMDTLFGKGSMKECIAYLERLQKMY